jgi:hypothetical protein
MRKQSALRDLARIAAKAYEASWERAKASRAELDEHQVKAANDDAWIAVVDAVMRGMA